METGHSYPFCAFWVCGGGSEPDVLFVHSVLDTQATQNTTTPATSVAKRVSLSSFHVSTSRHEQRTRWFWASFRYEGQETRIRFLRHTETHTINDGGATPTTPFPVSFLAISVVSRSTKDGRISWHHGNRTRFELSLGHLKDPGKDWCSEESPYRL